MQREFSNSEDCGPCFPMDMPIVYLELSPGERQSRPAITKSGAPWLSEVQATESSMMKTPFKELFEWITTFLLPFSLEHPPSAHGPTKSHPQECCLQITRIPSASLSPMINFQDQIQPLLSSSDTADHSFWDTFSSAVSSLLFPLCIDSWLLFLHLFSDPLLSLCSPKVELPWGSAVGLFLLWPTWWLMRSPGCRLPDIYPCSDLSLLNSSLICVGIWAPSSQEEENSNTEDKLQRYYTCCC